MDNRKLKVLNYPKDNDFKLGTIIIKFRANAQGEMEANLDRLISRKSDEEKALQENIDKFGETLKEHIALCEAFMKETAPEVNLQNLQSKFNKATDLWDYLQSLSKELEVVFKDFKLATTAKLNFYVIVVEQRRSPFGVRFHKVSSSTIWN
jgi:hypothetical protein